VSLAHAQESYVVIQNAPKSACLAQIRKQEEARNTAVKPHSLQAKCHPTETVSISKNYQYIFQYNSDLTT